MHWALLRDEIIQNSYEARNFYSAVIANAKMRTEK